MYVGMQKASKYQVTYRVGGPGLWVLESWGSVGGWVVPLLEEYMGTRMPSFSMQGCVDG